MAANKKEGASCVERDGININIHYDDMDVTVLHNTPNDSAAVHMLYLLLMEMQEMRQEIVHLNNLLEK